MTASIRDNHCRFRLEASNYGVVCYRGNAGECRIVAEKMATATWGRKLNPRTNRPILDSGETYGTFRIFDRSTRTYV